MLIKVTVFKQNNTWQRVKYSVSNGGIMQCMYYIIVINFVLPSTHAMGLIFSLIKTEKFVHIKNCMKCWL